MILFCEDCGEKNDLDPAAFAGGKAIFQCSVCGYNNAYSISSYQKVSSHKLTHFLGTIHAVPGIIGAFFFHNEQGVMAQKMPPVLSRNDIDALGTGLVRSYAEGCRSCSDITQMTVAISDKFFSVFKLSSHMYVCVISAGPDLPETILELIIRLGKEGL